MAEIWILGATGRVGRAVAARLAAEGIELTLVGRNSERLAAVAETAAGTVRILPAESLAATLELITREQPVVVINTIGPFTETAMPIVDACLPGSHYVDVSNELPAVNAVLDRHHEAEAAGRILVPASGFGVLGIEAAVLTACAALTQAQTTKTGLTEAGTGMTGIDTVRCDAMPLVAPESGAMGVALAGSIIGGLTDGGLRYSDGRLIRTGLGSRVETITTPDGITVRTGSAPTGELLVARRASGAPNVVAASSLVPTGLPIRAALTVVGMLARVGWIRSLLIRRLAAVEGSLSPDLDRKFTWARARVRTTSGETRTAWLRAGDAMDFTVGAIAEVATRLARGEGRPGAYTPGALFGPELAGAAGAELTVD